MLNINEIKDLDKAALLKKIDELRVELFSHKLQKQTTGIEKPHLLKTIKKDIARLNTVLSSKSGK